MKHMFTLFVNWSRGGHGADSVSPSMGFFYCLKCILVLILTQKTHSQPLPKYFKSAITSAVFHLSDLKPESVVFSGPRVSGS